MNRGFHGFQGWCKARGAGGPSRLPLTACRLALTLSPLPFSFRIREICEIHGKAFSRLSLHLVARNFALRPVRYSCSLVIMWS